MDHLNKSLSIIITVYNTERFIARCLDSVLEQSFGNVEIIVVNDGSKGDIREVIRPYLEKDKRIRFIDNPDNRGLFRARVCGAAEAKGDYIAFLDSDDYVSYDYYRALVQKACEEDADITIGRTVWEQNDGYRFVYNFHDSCFSFDCIRGDDIKEAYFGQESSCYSWHTVWNKIYSMKLWKRCEEFFRTVEEHIIMTEDILFSTVLFFNAKCLAAVRNDAYFYCINDGASTNVDNMTAGRFNKNIEDISNVFRYAGEYLADKGADSEVLAHFEGSKQYYQRMWKHFFEFGLRLSERAGVSNRARMFLDEAESSEPPSFYFESVQTPWNGGLEYIKEQIGKGPEKIISFDVFDTLVSRNFFEPGDLRELLDVIYTRLTGSSVKFSLFRDEAERIAREQAHTADPGTEDITLHDIYLCIEDRYGISRGILDGLEKAERDLELKACFPRSAGKELFDLAVCAGKSVYLISDMYLEKQTIEDILSKCGVRGYKELYVSSECKKLKAGGSLYRYFLEDTGAAPSDVLHIGDTWNSDILGAEKAGMHTVFFPKAKEVYQNGVQGINVNRCSVMGFELAGGLADIGQMMQNPGMRMSRALSFNRYFDNPYRFFNTESDFNADPYFIGYSALGPHIAGLCGWIADICRERKPGTIHFCARDGAVLMKACRIFAKVRPELDCNYNYIQASRKSLLPAMVRSRQDFYQLPVEFRGQTPESILRLTGFACEPVSSAGLKKMEKETGIAVDSRFTTREEFDRFIRYWLENHYSEEKHKESQKMIGRYYAQIGQDDLVFDMGYSGRIIDAIAFCCGHPVNALYVHENYTGSVRIRSSDTGVSINDYYGFKPCVSGLMREEILSEPAGSCVGFEERDGDIAPVFETDPRAYQDRYPIYMLQKGACDFMKDYTGMLQLCGSYCELPKTFASITFEGFLRNPSVKDRQIFGDSSFEDEVYGGAKSIRVVDYFNNQLAELDNNSYAAYTTERDTFMELIHRSSKLKRALLYIITDRKMFGSKLKKNVNELIGKGRK